MLILTCLTTAVGHHIVAESSKEDAKEHVITSTRVALLFKEQVANDNIEIDSSHDISHPSDPQKYERHPFCLVGCELLRCVG